MTWTLEQVPDQTGRIVVITGGNSGIGFEAARMLAGKGATVVLAVRSAERGHEAAVGIRAAHPDARVEVVTLDLASLASVRACSDALRRSYPRLDVLINNAGVMATPKRLTEDGFELQLGTNHLGHFALTGLVLDLLTGHDSRVVTVSSGAHQFGFMDFDDPNWERRYQKWLAYGRSKLANLLFTYELSRRLAAAHPEVKAVACHPGYADTNLQAVGPQMHGSAWREGLYAFLNRTIAQSAEQGACPTVYAAAMPEVESGDYIGPTGWFERAGAPGRVGSNRRSHDRDAQRRLWQVSEELTGVRYLSG